MSGIRIGWDTYQEGIVEAFIDYYTQILGAKTSERTYVDNFLIKLGPTISSEHREMITQEFIIREVKKALWDIGEEKTPRPDGYGN